MPYLGGFDIVEIGWAGRSCVYVQLDHGGRYDAGGAHPAGWRFQLYANRRLIGVTQDAVETRINGPVPMGGSACPLGVIVVDPDEAQLDFGHLLDLRPFNVYDIRWSDVANPDLDTHHFDIVAGRNPGEEYDVTNVLARVPFTGRPTYEYILPPFPARGDWSIAVIPRDDAQPLGNAGEPNEITIPTIIYPPDFEPIPVVGVGTKRLTAAVSNGVLTAGVTYQLPGQYPF